MRNILLIAIAFLMPVATWALGMPQWVKHTPKAGNDTYYYRVTKAEGLSYEEAYTRAFSMAILESQWKLGVKVTADNDVQSVERTLTQELNLKGGSMNLPMNKVCEYEQAGPNGGIILYCLWQVAAYGNIKVNFEEFLDCE